MSWPSDASIALPGSKSEANRLLVIAAMSGSEVSVRGVSNSDDVRHLVAGLATLGYQAHVVDGAPDVVRVGPRTNRGSGSAELFCGNAGTALRFLVSVAALTPGEWTLTGDQHMRRRPIQPLVDSWRMLGVDVSSTNGCPPVRVRGGQPSGGTIQLDPSVSSQFLSSLLLVGSRLPAGLDVRFTGSLASRAYAQLTCALLRRFGIEAELGIDHATIQPGAGPVPREVSVGGDWSAMGVWTCLNHLTGSRIRGSNLVSDSGQADERLAAVLAAFAVAGERVIDVEALPDQFLNLAVVAALQPGTTRLVGAHNVRVKECDRIAVMAAGLRRLGADLDELPDGLVVRGGALLHGAAIESHDDHRVAMAFALAGCLVPGVAVASPACVAKSYPDFWRDLATVRRQHRAVVVVGNRGAGKTTLARALAERCGSEFVDTDARFAADQGEIAAFVAQYGWEAFRTAEERCVADAMQPGRIIATGGGAAMSPRTRARLRERAVVLWLDAPNELLRQRLVGGDRPSVTGRPVLEEIDALAAARNPVFAELHDQRIDAELPIERQLAAALRGGLVRLHAG